MTRHYFTYINYSICPKIDCCQMIIPLRLALDLLPTRLSKTILVVSTKSSRNPMLLALLANSSRRDFSQFPLRHAKPRNRFVRDVHIQPN